MEVTKKEFKLAIAFKQWCDKHACIDEHDKNTFMTIDRRRVTNEQLFEIFISSHE